MNTTKKTTAKKIDFNSTVNQRIKEHFVSMHVYANVNSLVEYCLKHGFEDQESPVSFDSIENYYSYSEYYGTYAKFEGGTEAQRRDEIDRLTELKDELGSTDEEASQKELDIESEINDLYDLEYKGAEIFEWWAVSDFLYIQLKAQGYPVVDTGSCYVWGRTTTGQAILLDGVISRICSGMEILEGQSNSWENRK